MEIKLGVKLQCAGPERIQLKRGDVTYQNYNASTNNYYWSRVTLYCWNLQLRERQVGQEQQLRVLVQEFQQLPLCQGNVTYHVTYRIFGLDLYLRVSF